MKNTISTSVTTSNGTSINASRGSVLYISIMLPSMISGARVPMRSEICTSRWKMFASLDSRTIS